MEIYLYKFIILVRRLSSQNQRLVIKKVFVEIAVMLQKRSKDGTSEKNAYANHIQLQQKENFFMGSSLLLEVNFHF